MKTTYSFVKENYSVAVLQSSFEVSFLLFTPQRNN